MQAIKQLDLDLTTRMKLESEREELFWKLSVMPSAISLDISTLIDKYVTPCNNSI
jgi:hypothetical protein